jgi:hypothetical protein
LVADGEVVSVLLSRSIQQEVERSIHSYPSSRLSKIFDDCQVPPYAIKFVPSAWAATYAKPQPLKVSNTPALTWGTGTYVTPISFPLSSVLYGRVGLVTDFDPSTWKIFDATDPAAQSAYIRWARAQANFPDLIFTVHSTYTNHVLRNKFRKDFEIDCVLFHPDQEAEIHTDRDRHVWMLVTDWASKEKDEFAEGFSGRLSNARFTVLIDEEFDLMNSGLPIQIAARKIEATTLSFGSSQGMPVRGARAHPGLAQDIIGQFAGGGYLHVYIEP